MTAGDWTGPGYVLDFIGGDMGRAKRLRSRQVTRRKQRRRW